MLLNLFTLNNYNNQPVFGYRLPKRSFNDIRDIPGLTCAKCGEKMFSLIERDEFINKLLAGSKTCLKNHEFDEFRNSNRFRFLQNLANRHPRTPLAVIVEDKTIKYKISKFGGFGQREVSEIVDISKNITKNAPQVIKKLMPLKERMPDAYKELLDYMEVYAIKYPDNSFSEIFKKKDVFDYHNKIRLFRKEQFSLLKNKALTKLNKTAELLPQEEKAKMIKLNSELLNIISPTYYPDSTKHIMLELLYEDFISALDDKKLAANIKKQLKNIPLNEVHADNLIVGYSKLNDREIIKEILDNVSATFEHIIPGSKDGPDSKHNGICLCKRCNQERATIAYSVMMEKFPEFSQNIQKQLNKVMAFIKNKKLTGYELYPQRVKKTLLDVTDQKLRINIKKFLKFKEKEAEIKLEHAKASYIQNKTRLQETNSEISEYNKKIDELKQELKRLQDEKNILHHKKEIRKAKVNNSTRILANAKSNLKSARKTLNNDK